ncbi:L-aspartate oxidase [Enterobacter cloacae]|uniref:L-aspartate oxidase n=1 Tax=Enterobacter cloacae TaxID=550 RepID=A0A377LUZ7_ENTCL|nr:L-aspartate oxidase [Enterobacter cloacae]
MVDDHGRTDVDGLYAIGEVSLYRACMARTGMAIQFVGWECLVYGLVRSGGYNQTHAVCPPR